MGTGGSDAGAKVGASAVSIESVGVGGFANTVLRAGNVALSANVYDLASATLGATSLTLGNVRVAGTAGFDVTNTVVTDAAFQDSLDVVATAANGKLTFANPARLAAGATGAVTLTAATAGVLDATVAVGLTSNANGLAGLTNVGLAGQSVAVTGAAYDFAQPTVAATLALGNVRARSAGSLAVTNAVVTDAAFQDSLDVTATTAVANLAVTAPGNILAGQTRAVGVAIGRASCRERVCQYV